MISKSNIRAILLGLKSLALCNSLLCLSVLLFLLNPAKAGTFTFAGENLGVDIITHPSGYDGTGGVLTVGVCIDSTSTNATDMIIPIENMVDTFNKRQAHSPNLTFGSDNLLAFNEVDFESVALHELGHCLALGHVNAANGTGPNSNYTSATDGADNTLNINAGTDGIIGSKDDLRQDDINLHWFNKTTNNPCAVDNSIVDTSTYSVDIVDLPTGDSFAANADRDVCASLSAPDTEAVMQQLTFTDETQRRLAQNGISTLKLGMSGLDETAETADDYTLNLVSLGVVVNPSSNPDCDVIADFDNSQTGFAVCSVGATFLPANHMALTSANMFFNTSANWYFNDVRDSDIFCGGGPFVEDTDLNLGTDTIIDERRFRAAQSIISESTVEATGCLSLSAGTQISFGPGFAVKGGALFKAGIE